MRSIRGGLLQGLDHYLFHLGVVDGTGRTGPRFVAETIKTPLGEPVPPLAHRREMTTQLLGNIHIGHTLSRSQNDPATQRQRLAGGMPPRPPLQSFPFLIAQLDNHRLTPLPSTHHSTFPHNADSPHNPTTNRGELTRQDTRSMPLVWAMSRMGVRLRSPCSDQPHPAFRLVRFLGGGLAQVESANQKRRHLSSGHRLVRAEPQRLDSAAHGDTRSSDSINVGGVDTAGGVHISETGGDSGR